MHQKKIQGLELEVNKAFQQFQNLKEDYQQSKEMYEICSEKADVLESTLTSLKRELHTQKQTYKMKLLSVVLKKRQTIFHLNQRQSQTGNEETAEQSLAALAINLGINIETLSRGISKEALLDQIQKNYEANFDKQKAEQTIADLESDISRLVLKNNQAHDVFQSFKQEFDAQALKYEKVKKIWETANDQKQKLIDRMNSQLEMFETDKKAQIAQVGNALSDIYKASYVPKFAQFMPSEPSLSDRYRSESEDAASNSSAVRKATQGSSYDPTDGQCVIVMNENAEEVSIANMSVAFNHQLHELEQSKLPKAQQK